MAVWGFLAAALARAVGIDAYAVFTAGMVAGPAVVAGLVLWALARTFKARGFGGGFAALGPLWQDPARWSELVGGQEF